MAPEALMVGLLKAEAESVRKAAVAYSRKLELQDQRKLIRGSRAPASTILTLFLQEKHGHDSLEC